MLETGSFCALSASVVPAVAAAADAAPAAARAVEHHAGRALGRAVGVGDDARRVVVEALEVPDGDELLGEVLDLAELADLVGGDEGEGAAGVARTAGAADAVDVVLRVHGDVEVHDGVDAGDVDAAAHDVGRDEDLAAALAEL